MSASEIVSGSGAVSGRLMTAIAAAIPTNTLTPSLQTERVRMVDIVLLKNICALTGFRFPVSVATPAVRGALEARTPAGGYGRQR